MHFKSLSLLPLHKMSASSSGPRYAHDTELSLSAPCGQQIDLNGAQMRLLLKSNQFQLLFSRSSVVRIGCFSAASNSFAPRISQRFHPPLLFHFNIFNRTGGATSSSLVPITIVIHWTTPPCRAWRTERPERRQSQTLFRISSTVSMVWVKSACPLQEQRS